MEQDRANPSVNIDEIRRRKTFAIISHPDAGKTTFTEKLLLYGGVLREAGTVKAKSGRKYVTSDWMELERKRGISVTTTAIQFEHQGYCVNLLDTPGHKDFSEDTYRTLMAVDAAVMLIDAAKGIETQTRKLFEVCRQAALPIFTFVNKMDREAKSPIQLLDEIEGVLGLKCSPANWPLGVGSTFSGVFDTITQKLYLFDRKSSKQKKYKVLPKEFSNPSELRNLELFQNSFEKAALETFLEEIELVNGACEKPNKDLILSGNQSPIFFGSAMNNFGIELFLNFFVKVAPSPVPRKMVSSESYPSTGKFSGVVFKVQANMDPQHRDCLAFLRICSGFFEKGIKVKNTRSRKDIRIHNAFSIVGRDRSPIDRACAGDIIGVVDTGRQLSIGDTIAVENHVEYHVWPRFLPEVFSEIIQLQPERRKQLSKGLEQMANEGVIQCLWPVNSSDPLPTLGAVGELQFDVFTHRLQTEYNVKILLRRMPFQVSRWINGESKNLPLSSGREWTFFKDIDDNILVAFCSEWSIRTFQNVYKSTKLISDFNYVLNKKRDEVDESI